MKRFLSVLMSLAALHLAAVISLSTKFECDGHDSLHLIVHDLTKRLAQLEVDVSTSNVNHKSDVLENKLRQVKDENRLLRNKLLNLEEKLEQLQLNNIALQNSVTELIQQNQKSVKKVSSWSNGDKKPHVLPSEIASNQNTTGNSTERDVIDEKNNGLINPVPDIMYTAKRNGTKYGHQIVTRQTPTEQVAFFAQVSVPALHNLGVGHIIPFDRTVTNVGGAYHPHTGVFIAPYSGLYVFHVSATFLAEGDYQYLQLTRDGEVMQSLFLEKTDIESASVTVVLEVNKGSEVWVKADAGSGYIHGNGYTVFTGWLLQQF